MEFKVSGANKRQPSAAVESSKLSFYDVAPATEIALEEFEQYAMDRLRVLKKLEEARSRGKKVKELDTVVSDLWRSYMQTGNAAETSKKDAISHFILRLAYCRTEELRRWFLATECTLFRHRLSWELPEAQKKLMEECNLPYKAITPAEFEAVKDKLQQVARSLNVSPPSVEHAYYKVPFEEVSDLVSGRRVYLQRGEAFVAREQLASLIVGQFRARLSKALALTNRKWIAFVADKEKDRLTPMVEALSTRYLGPDYSQVKSSGQVAVEDLDSFASTSFPLCMRSLFYKLREDHHLRHGGRQQLGLFLKGIGLKLEDALAFWRTEFSRKMGVEKFDKEYAYNVRHNYGKEGKRTDYTPYSCIKIIMSTPGVGDHHGCPYRHFSEDNLRAALSGMNLNAAEISSAIDKVRNQHYQLACAEVFEAVHGVPTDGINHPNQYFEQSRKIFQKDKEQEPANSKRSAAAPVFVT